MSVNEGRLAAASPPASNLPEAREIARLWESFVSDRETDLSLLPCIIRDAWVRSKEQRIDICLTKAPYSEPEINREQAISGTDDLLEGAEPIIAFLRSTLSEPHQLLLLADAEGRILRTHGGVKALSRAREICAVPGGRWGEQDVGCCVLGTSIRTGMPVQIRWHEHYCMNWQDWVSHSTPIHDPISHEVLGAVSLSGYRELSHHKAAEVVARTAEMIEARIREQTLRARAEIIDYFVKLNSRYPSDALVALDGRGRIINFNSWAESSLSLSRMQALERRFQELPAIRDRIETALTGEASAVTSAKIFAVRGDSRAGAVALLPRPSQPSVPERALQPWTASYRLTDLIGQTSRFRELLDFALEVSRHEWPVLLLGESGTGKEMFAHVIHNTGPRQRGPFVPFNCSGVNDELVGSELFGYVEGAFTGAMKGGRQGKFELASGGTLFLDDIDGMPPRMQASLLRALEEKRVLPLGATRPREVDVRIIASSNADLERAVKEGSFRLDLYHRLNVFSLLIPPLRERQEDIPSLVRHLLERYAPATAIATDVLDTLAQYDWPGNVRELRNVLIAASTRACNGRIELADLPQKFQHTAPSTLDPSATVPAHSLRNGEVERIIGVVREAGGVAQAAATLGVHYSTLYRRIRKYGIELPAGRRRF